MNDSRPPGGGCTDAAGAEARLTFLAGLTLLEISEDALTLAQRLRQPIAIPQDFPEDALHFAVAVVNGIDTPHGFKLRLSTEEVAQSVAVRSISPSA